MNRRTHQARRGFTLVELLLAAMITAFVVGSVAVALSQLSRARAVSRERFDTFLKADAALERIRRDVASIVRHQDLFWSRVLISTDTQATDVGTMPRSELLLFTTRLRPIREIDYNGEGTEFESQYRVVDDSNGAVLWNRVDAVPDEYPAGGGIASPVVDGIAGLLIEAYDGDTWYDEWDSDFDGIPRAIRVTVMAAEHSERVRLEPLVAELRTVIALDRVPPPLPPEVEEPEDQEGAEGIGEGGTDADALGGVGGVGGRGGADGEGGMGGGGPRGGGGMGNGGGPGGPGAGGGTGGGAGGGTAVPSRVSHPS